MEQAQGQAEHLHLLHQGLQLSPCLRKCQALQSRLVLAREKWTSPERPCLDRGAPSFLG